MRWLHPLAALAMLSTLPSCQLISGLDGLQADLGPDAGLKPDGGQAGRSGSSGEGQAGRSGSGGSGGNGDSGACVKALADSECDLVQQCGCTSPKSCQAVVKDGKASASCATPGNLHAGDVCRDSKDCPAAYSCERNLCRRYCENDGDCDSTEACHPALTADGKSVAGVNVCWLKCDMANGKPCKTGTRCTGVSIDGNSMSYCVGPADPCPSANNGSCDEPDVCASGTDQKDCTCKPSISGAKCDLVMQCGCPQGQHCQFGDTAPQCVVPGNTAVGELCNQDSECVAGSACIGDICKRYCASDKDCGNGLCRDVIFNGQAIPGVKACLTTCDFPTQKPCGKGVSCGRFSPGDVASLPNGGDFCIVASSDCVTDNVCDEPAWGTRLCTTGSDAADCACTSSVPGATCDLAKQCGCSPGTHCALTNVQGTQATLGCSSNQSNAKPKGSVCSSESDCAAGLSCWRGMCERYCSSNADCGSGQCTQITNSGDVTGVKVCSIPCTFATEQECSPGTRCARPPSGGDLCFVPRSPCIFPNNGTCDEPDPPNGSRLCVDGSDAPDCP
jgi:hypothetical protein